jgi:NADH:ubiquinone oxidoreductase subunit E
VRKRPRSVKAEKCTGCGDCWTACPVRKSAQDPPAFQPSEPLGPADAAALDGVLARHEASPGRLMPVLQEISQSYGYLPRNVLEHLAWRWGLRVAEILRVASFYDRFQLEPAGRHTLEVCEGTSCHSRRSRALLEGLEEQLGIAAGRTGESGRFTLRTVRCLGLCALAPAMKVDGRSFGRVELARVPEILEQFP